MKIYKKHKSVMKKDVVKFLDILQNKIYIDLTFGSGGHAFEINKYLNKDSFLIINDKDKNCKKYIFIKKNLKIFFMNFDIISYVAKLNIIKIAYGTIIDLGISYNQLLKKKNGICFLKNNFLDMRINNKSKTKCIEWLKNDSQKNVHFIINFLKNKKSKHNINLFFKKNIITSHKFKYFLKKKFSLTKIYGILRMFINNDIRNLNLLLKNIKYINKNKTILLSFNSLEDKIIKNQIKKYIEKRPSIEELNNNLSARSGFMRVF